MLYSICNVCFQVYIYFQDYVRGRCYSVSYRCCGRRLWFSGLCPCMPTGCASAHPYGTHDQRLWGLHRIHSKNHQRRPYRTLRMRFHHLTSAALHASKFHFLNLFLSFWKQHPESQLFLTPSILSCGWQALVTPAVKPLYLWSPHQWTETELSGMK